MESKDTIVLILLIVAVIADVITRVLANVKSSNNNATDNSLFSNIVGISDLLNDIIKSLFLFAQKQDWTNEQRMQYVVAQVLATFPNNIADIIGMPVADYVQNLYNKFTSSYKELDKQLENNSTSE